MTNTNTIISSAPDQCQAMLNNYASIVEKTNNQLGLWSNPYGLMVGILTLLMAIGAIFITYLLWRNSKDQKEITKQFFIEQKALIEEKNKIIEKIQLKFELTESGCSEKAKDSAIPLVEEFQNFSQDCRQSSAIRPPERKRSA